MSTIPTRTEYDRAALNALRHLEKIGTLPAAVTKAQTQAQATVDNVRNLAAAAGPEEMAELFGRLAAGGKARPGEEEVTRALLANIVTTRPEVLTVVGQNAMTAIRSAMSEHAAELVEMLREPFDAAVDELDAAAEILTGVEDLDDLAAVTSLGGEAADAWKRAKAAEAVVLATEATLLHLSTARCYHRTGDGRERRLAVLDATLEGYRHVRQQTRPWELRKRGELSLATSEEFAERVERLDAEWSQHPQNPANRVGPGVGQYPVRSAGQPQTVGGAL